MFMSDLIGFELDLMDRLSKLPKFFDYLALLITEFGGQMILIGIIGILYWCIDKKMGEKVGVIALFTINVNNLLKGIVLEKRPYQHDGYAHLQKLPGKDSSGGSTSFPSGHSQNSSTIYTTLALNYHHRTIRILCIILIFLVPISRVLLGVHFPHDVLVGSILGIITAIGLNTLINRLEKASFYIYLISFIIFLPTIIFFPTKDGFVGYGLLWGLFLGTMIEHRFINFTTDVGLKFKLLRVLIGIITLLIIKEGGKALLLLFYEKEEIPYFLDMIRYFLIAFFASGIIPFAFRSEKNPKGV